MHILLSIITEISEQSKLPIGFIVAESLNTAYLFKNDSDSRHVALSQRIGSITLHGTDIELEIDRDESIYDLADPSVDIIEMMIVKIKKAEVLWAHRGNLR